MNRVRIIPVVLLWFATALPAFAEPRAYVLVPEESKVQFTYHLYGQPATGTMPIHRADLSLDLAKVSNSRARVDLDAARARTKVPFVTQTLKGPDVLWTDAHPHIKFASTRITGDVNGAKISGAVTIRGITRPLTLEAQIFRRTGSETGDLSRLTVLLTGSIQRSAFGATGYARDVDDRIDLQIIARLRRVD